MNTIEEISCDNWVLPDDADDLIIARNNLVNGYMQSQNVEATIWIIAYNRLDKVKQCIQSVLDHTKDVTYKLLLVDNGSSDGTFEYFKSVEHPYKSVIRFQKNFKLYYLGFHLFNHIEGRYLACLSDDIVVTPRWLSNMITCAKSDPRIGMVNPMSSNISNLQSYQVEFHNYEEMQKKAYKINQSNPQKWHERLRIITIGTMYTRECLLAVGWPLNDPGFTHDFIDDDITFAVRRAGYKTILAKDVWIYHDHPAEMRKGHEKEQQHSLETGRKNFQEKYYGIDAWDDVNNYALEFMPHVMVPKDQEPKILGIDVKCGTPILEIKNKLREFDIFQAELSAFNQDAKYQIDLQTICKGIVACDREEFMKDYYLKNYFDTIFVGKHINCYHEPVQILLDAISLLKKEGQLFITLKNVNTIFSFLNILGYRNVTDSEYAYNYSAEIFMQAVSDLGFDVRFLAAQNYSVQKMAEQDIQFVQKKLEKIVKKEEVNELTGRLMIDYFAFEIKKKNG